jgi:protein TorT
VLDDARKRGLEDGQSGPAARPAWRRLGQGEVDGTRYAAQVADLEVNIIDIRYGDSDAGEQAELASQMLARYGNKIDYLIGCTGCARPPSPAESGQPAARSSWWRSPDQRDR